MKKYVLVISADSAVGHALWELPVPEPIEVITTDSVAEAVLSIVKQDYTLIVADTSLCTQDIVLLLRKATEVPVLEINSGRAYNSFFKESFCASINQRLPIYLTELWPKAVELLTQACQTEKCTLRCSVKRRNDLIVQRTCRRVYLNNRELTLTRTEYEILCLLATRQEMVFPYDFIFDAIWCGVCHNAKEVVQNHVARLRKKMGRTDYVEAVHGVGYRLAQHHGTEGETAPAWGSSLYPRLSN